MEEALRAALLKKQEQEEEEHERVKREEEERKRVKGLEEKPVKRLMKAAVRIICFDCHRYNNIYYIIYVFLSRISSKQKLSGHCSPQYCNVHFCGASRCWKTYEKVAKI